MNFVQELSDTRLRLTENTAAAAAASRTCEIHENRAPAARHEKRSKRKLRLSFLRFHPPLSFFHSSTLSHSLSLFYFFIITTTTARGKRTCVFVLGEIRTRWRERSRRSVVAGGGGWWPWWRSSTGPMPCGRNAEGSVEPRASVAATPINGAAFN